MKLIYLLCLLLTCAKNDFMIKDKKIDEIINKIINTDLKDSIEGIDYSDLKNDIADICNEYNLQGRDYDILLFTFSNIFANYKNNDKKREELVLLLVKNIEKDYGKDYLQRFIRYIANCREGDCVVKNLFINEDYEIIEMMMKHPKEFGIDLYKMGEQKGIRNIFNELKTNEGINLEELEKLIDKATELKIKKYEGYNVSKQKKKKATQKGKKAIDTRNSQIAKKRQGSSNGWGKASRPRSRNASLTDPNSQDVNTQISLEKVENTFDDLAIKGKKEQLKTLINNHTELINNVQIKIDYEDESIRQMLIINDFELGEGVIESIIRLNQKNAMNTLINNRNNIFKQFVNTLTDNSLKNMNCGKDMSDIIEQNSPDTIGNVFARDISDDKDLGEEKIVIKNTKFKLYKLKKIEGEEYLDKSEENKDIKRIETALSNMKEGNGDTEHIKGKGQKYQKGFWEYRLLGHRGKSNIRIYYYSRISDKVIFHITYKPGDDLPRQVEPYKKKLLEDLGEIVSI